MARLIDADALKVDWYDDYEMDDGDEYSYPYVSQYQIDKAPTIDAVPVVRCKDCKWKADTIGDSWCDFHEFTILSDDDYCSWGERKDDE